MKRYDLRELNENFTDRLVELMNSEVLEDENGIFLFEVGDSSPIQNVADIVKENHKTPCILFPFFVFPHH